MRRPPDFAGFADVDGSGGPGDYADYLDAVRAVGAVGEWKERSIGLLEPRPGGVLLDVGCGTDDDVRALAALVAPGGRAIGIDASVTMIEEAVRRAAGVAAEFRVGDATALGLATGSVDGARAERTLQHLDRPDAAVVEMSRVVRPGGRVVVSEPDWSTLIVDPGDPEVTREVARAASERVRSGFVGRRLRGLLLAAGLTEVGVAARTLTVTDAARARMVFDLDGALARAVAERRVSASAAAGWSAALARAAVGGRMLAALTAFMAWGRVPPRA